MYTVNEASKKYNISVRRVQLLCEQGRITGAEMVKGHWLIPEDAAKPTDKRKKVNRDISLSDSQFNQVLSDDEVCAILSISKATLKNWIRLKKITPDIGGDKFSLKYINQFSVNLKLNDTKLKHRRNKTNISGKILYKDYIHNSINQSVVSKLLQLEGINEDQQLRIILANFAVQLYYQSRRIEFHKNNVILDFLSGSQVKDLDFKVLIQDLIANNDSDIKIDSSILPALDMRVNYVKEEDLLGYIYISMHDIGQRKKLGIYYTPDSIVNLMIDNLCEGEINIDNKTIYDPCCGTGNFLLSLKIRGIDYTHLYGQDIDPISVFLTRINLALCTLNFSAKLLCQQITIGNSYFNTPKQKFDIVIGNPPWGSDFTHEDELRCRQLFKCAMDKYLESYDLFMEKAFTLIKENGTIAFLLPEAILNVSSHDNIRQQIIAHCSFRFISYLGNVFHSIQCPVIILGITLDSNRTTFGCRVTTSNNTYIISQNRDFPDGTISLHVTDEEYFCMEKIYNLNNAVYLKDNAIFALGIVTGNNKNFLSDQPKDGYEIILKGSNVFRYGISGKMNYIKFNPESFQQTAPVEYYRAKEKLFYRFIGELPVFTYDNKQRLSLNSCNIIIPKIDGLSIKYILAILNSRAAAFFTLKRFNSIKLLRSHIEQIPIPFVPKITQEKIIALVDILFNPASNIQVAYNKLDDIIMELYGLNHEQIFTIHKALNGKSLLLIEN